VAAAKTSLRDGGSLVVRDCDAGVQARYTLGRGAFLKISRVEGISPTAEAIRRAEEFERMGLSSEERRRAIIAAHRAKT